jgi:hypothetical protein
MLDTIEVALTVPNSEKEFALGLLDKEPAFQAEVVPSTGAEGGGGLSVLVIRLGKATIGGLSQIMGTLASGQDVKLQIGQTKLDAKRLRNPDLNSILEKTLEVELKRAAASRRK